VIHQLTMPWVVFNIFREEYKKSIEKFWFSMLFEILFWTRLQYH
jgi:hypothetical protein